MLGKGSGFFSTCVVFLAKYPGAALPPQVEFFYSLDKSAHSLAYSHKLSMLLECIDVIH